MLYFFCFFFLFTQQIPTRKSVENLFFLEIFQFYYQQKEENINRKKLSVYLFTFTQLQAIKLPHICNDFYGNFKVETVVDFFLWKTSEKNC